MVRGLKRGGVTVVIGAGAMGRMHVALAMSYRPRAIVVADFVESRLQVVKDLFASRAQTLDIKLCAIHPAAMNLKTFVDELTDYAGADDVIVAVGSRKAIEEAQQLLARGAVLNLFGGLKKGEAEISVDSSIVHYQEINITGSSGGSPWDVAKTLELFATHEIDAGDHIARVGDLEHAAEFLQLIIAREIDGKAVVYPHRRSPRIRTVKSWTAQDEHAYLAGHED
jgi:L-iditol 2-dehydrogenase